MIAGAAMPAPILAKLGGLCAQLHDRGYTAATWRHDEAAMGSFLVRFHRSDSDELVVVCDRGQLTVEGNRALLEPHGLWRVFDEAADFADTLMRFVDLRASQTPGA